MKLAIYGDIIGGNSDLMQNKIVGKILSVRCEVGQFLPSWRPNIDYRESVSARKALGGGALLELSHEIDYLMWIFGDIDWVKATLEMTHRHWIESYPNLVI